MKLLIVEDERALLNSVQSYLIDEGYHCDASATYADADEKLSQYKYDCILIDINLPDGNGLDLIKLAKKQNSATGIIIISAKNSLDDRISALQLGADDYLIKPFHLSELNARVFSLLRRINFDGNEIITFNEIEVNPVQMVVKVKGTPLELTRKEYDLLIYFISNKDRILTREAISEYLWNDYTDFTGSLDFVYTHIKNLRKKISEKGGTDYIQTVYGVGYKFLST